MRVVTARLQPFHFAMTRGRERAVHIFYAPDPTTARSYAEDWATRHGWTLEEDA